MTYLTFIKKKKILIIKFGLDPTINIHQNFQLITNYLNHEITSSTRVIIGQVW